LRQTFIALLCFHSSLWSAYEASWCRDHILNPISLLLWLLLSSSLVFTLYRYNNSILMNASEWKPTGRHLVIIMSMRESFCIYSALAITIRAVQFSQCMRFLSSFFCTTIDTSGNKKEGVLFAKGFWWSILVHVIYVKPTRGIIAPC